MSEHDFEHVTHFPVKLWDVVNDDNDDIFRWSADGSSFYVDDRKYETDVMIRYPGFVQISSFANLRRLLREYSFKWQNNDTGEFQFSHTNFQRGKRQDIFLIKTKRKAIQAATGQHTKPRRRGTTEVSNQKSVKSWLQPVSANNGVRLRMETLLRFPEKFWEVVNDTNDLLYWGEDGTSIIVDDKKYEEEIMTRYPGFVQINSFANLRRLLREYGFSWNIRENGFFEFSHANMKRGMPELLSGVQTKRKAMKAGAHHPYLPFFRSNDSPVYGPDGKCILNQMDSYSPLAQHRSPSEVNQAVGTIQTTQSDVIHSRDITQTIGNEPPVNLNPLYGLQTAVHAYRYFPYPNLTTNAHHQTNWLPTPLPQPGEKEISPFFYSAWSDHNTNYPMKPEQKDLEVRPSSTGIEPSSAGSCESVYGNSTSKTSPVNVALLKNSTDAAVKLPGMMTAGGFAGHGVYPPATHPAAYCEPIYPHPYSQQFTGEVMAFKQHDDQYDNISMISPHSTRSGASDTVSHSPDGITVDRAKVVIDSNPSIHDVSPREEKSSSASSVLSDILRENGHISEPDSPVCVTRTGCKDHRYSPKQQMINKL